MAEHPRRKILHGRKTGRIVGVECRDDGNHVVIRVTETIFGTSHLAEVKLPRGRNMTHEEMVDHAKTMLG